MMRISVRRFQASSAPFLAAWLLALAAPALAAPAAQGKAAQRGPKAKAAPAAASKTAGAKPAASDAPRKDLVPRKVLVLDFVNLQEAKDYNYLVVSIPEGMVEAVQKTGFFATMNRDVAAPIIADEELKPADLAKEGSAIAVGRKAGADVVVAGSFAVVGNAVQYHARAIEVDTGRTAVAEKAMSGTDATIFAAIEKLSAKLAAGMQAKLPPIPPREIVKTEYESSGGVGALSLAAYAGQLAPLGGMSDAIGPGLRFGGALYLDDIVRWERIGLGFAVDGSYSMSAKADGFPAKNDLSVAQALARLELALPGLFHRNFTLAALPGFGFAFTSLAAGVQKKTYSSTDYAFDVRLELRWRLASGLYAFGAGSYGQVLYSGDPFETYSALAGIGWRFGSR